MDDPERTAAFEAYMWERFGIEPAVADDGSHYYERWQIEEALERLGSREEEAMTTVEVLYMGGPACVLAGEDCDRLGHRTEAVALNPDGAWTACLDCTVTYGEAVLAEADPDLAVAESRRLAP
jgi:hypothetical protein